MESRSVSRCVAIAAHGKRCQQSPFRGSPYCWHHTQSRKIWAPSRPLGSGATAAGRGVAIQGPAPGDDLGAGLDGRAGANGRVERTAAEGAALRLGDRLGPARVEELLDFLESPADGAFLLVKDEAGLLSERSVSERPARRRRSA
jgi:hypothetical protein